MKYTPVVGNFYATTFVKAYVLNALAVALITAGGIELRELLNDEKSNAYLFFNGVIGTGALNDYQKTGIVFAGTFLVAMFAYAMLYLLFGFGGGMLAATKN